MCYSTGLPPGSGMCSRHCPGRRKMLAEPKISLFPSKHEHQNIYRRTPHPHGELLAAEQEGKERPTDFQVIVS